MKTKNININNIVKQQLYLYFCFFVFYLQCLLPLLFQHLFDVLHVLQHLLLLLASLAFALFFFFFLFLFFTSCCSSWRYTCCTVTFLFTSVSFAFLYYFFLLHFCCNHKTFQHNQLVVFSLISKLHKLKFRLCMQLGVVQICQVKVHTFHHQSLVLQP